MDPGHRPFNLPIIVSVSILNLWNLLLQNYCQTCCCRSQKSFGLVENIPIPLTSAGDPLVLRLVGRKLGWPQKAQRVLTPGDKWSSYIWHSASRKESSQSCRCDGLQ